MTMCVCIKESDAGETVENNFRVYPPHSAVRATNFLRACVRHIMYSCNILAVEHPVWLTRSCLLPCTGVSLREAMCRPCKPSSRSKFHEALFKPKLVCRHDTPSSRMCCPCPLLHATVLALRARIGDTL